jgi:RNA polymerase sigma factor (sigma-70 family)
MKPKHLKGGGGGRLADAELIDLVHAAQRGEPGALDALLTKLRPWFVAGFGRKMGRDAAEDTTQVVLIRIARTFRQIDPARVHQYMITVARNVIRELRRSGARDAWRSTRVAIGYGLEEPVPPDVEVERRDLVRAVRASLATLSPKLRHTVLAVLRGQRPSDIAAQEGVNPNTIRTRLLYARTLLWPKLRPYADVRPAPDKPRSGAARRD